MSLILTPLSSIPLINPGDDLIPIIMGGSKKAKLDIQDQDIFILSSKIISKSENCYINLETIIPSPRAEELAAQSGKDPRLCELILNESREILRVRQGTIIVEHNLGFICANAGIDQSNVNPFHGITEKSGNWVICLPLDPDRSARTLQKGISKSTGKQIGILIIDSHGRAWRLGVVGSTIGLAGVPGLIDKRGEKDLFGYEMKVTVIGVADELAAAGSLIMGETNEGTPIIHVRGFPYSLRDGTLEEMLRPRSQDLFR